ncbi:MAG: LysR family transcriptional regulator [Aestuariivirga sp.]
MKEIHYARIDLNLLEVFDAVAQTRSATLAAKQLALGQSAISHALNRLRDMVGDPLFVRGSGGLVPTPHALTMVEPVRTLLRNARDVLNPAAFEPESSTRRFKVGASDYAMLTTIPHLVRRVRSGAPNTVIEVIAIGEHVLSQLEGGALDIAFFGAAPPAAPFLSHKLFEEHFVGLMCARHRLALRAGQGQLTLEDYLTCPQALVTFRDPRRSPIDAALMHMNRSRQIALVTPNFASNVAALPGTNLIMSIPSRLADSLGHLDLVRFDLPLTVPPYPYSLLWHRRTDRDPACSWLRLQATGHGR